MGRRVNIHAIGIPKKANPKDGFKDRTLKLPPATEYLIRHFEWPCPSKSGHKWSTLPNASKVTELQR